MDFLKERVIGNGPCYSSSSSVPGPGGTGPAGDTAERPPSHVWFPGRTEVKNLPADAGGAGHSGSIPGLGRSPGGGNGSPLQYSCLVNPMDRGVWWATVYSVAKS